MKENELLPLCASAPSRLCVKNLGVEVVVATDLADFFRFEVAYG
jgi:hypothetical protein